jgi:outer membrane autotransporter protein
MPFTKQRLIFAIALALGASSIQHACAQDDLGLGYQHPAPPDASFANHATTANGRQVGKILDGAIQSAMENRNMSPEHRRALFDLQDELLRNPNAASEALEQLAGSQNANLAAATQNGTEQITAHLLSAMRTIPTDSVGDDNGRLWLQGLGASGRLDSQGGSAGLKQGTQGLLMGVDWAVDPAWRAGLMGGKTSSDFDAKRFDAALDSWHLGAYAVRQDGPLALRLGAIYSSHDGNNKRNVDVFGEKNQLKGTYNAQSQTAFGEVGYQVGQGTFSVEPFAGIGYQRYHRDSFKEKGGNAALNVGAQTQENLSSTFGIRLASLHTLDNQMSLTPHLSSNWKHLYGDVGSQVRQSSRRISKMDLNGNFTTQGTALDRDSLAIRAGLDLALSEYQTVGLTYNVETGNNSHQQGLMGNWQMAF